VRTERARASPVCGTGVAWPLGLLKELAALRFLFHVHFG